MTYQREPTARTIRWARRLHGERLQFTGCSQYICNQGLQRGGGNWTAIHNFVDLKTYDFVPKVSEDAPLVFLSRIEPIKGTHLAIEIAKLAGRRLLIAGNYQSSGPHARYWQECIEPELGRNGIEYVGTVNDQQKNQLLGSATAMLVPIQWNEPFGIVFAESLACGTPVISFPTGAIPEIIDDGKHGYHINSVSDGVLAVKKIGALNRYDCRERAEQSFSQTVISQSYIQLYRSILGLEGRD